MNVHAEKMEAAEKSGRSGLSAVGGVDRLRTDPVGRIEHMPAD